jgi:chemotaxis receptor (MCP) glutamine deamidase CheD
VSKLAFKQLNNEVIHILLDEYDRGESPASLAIKYGVHPTTIRRYLRNNNRKLGRVTHATLIDTDVKVEMRKVLSKFNIKNLDIVISELDKNFLIEKRMNTEDDDFKIINLN